MIENGSLPHDEPNIFSYLDICLYLQDVYSYRKKLVTGFSYELWAQEMDVKSKSYLRFTVIRKRKISDEMAQKYIQNLKLDPHEKDYFVYLVLYSQAKNAEQKKVYGEKLTQLLRSNKNIPEVPSNADLLSNPLVIAVRSLLTFVDVTRTVTELSRLLKRPQAEIESALHNLQSQNLAEFVNGQWQATQDYIRVPTTPADKAILSYHRESLLKAIDSQNLPADERSYRSLTLALSQEEYQNYLSELGCFVTQLFGKFKSESLTSKRLYQINFNLFPWTFSKPTED